ncbi:hypothetical protein PBY51_002732 [Eleginops maclovinus]|uniref:Uncharacterized protein n=1 Tax=Eleginops maclovinus TaxID=56733 RepID=A0AAN7X8U1_ELEMC|nr:hypothetical protein PBY51_002732 [Eleginops maclovinus]
MGRVLPTYSTVSNNNLNRDYCSSLELPRGGQRNLYLSEGEDKGRCTTANERNKNVCTTNWRVHMDSLWINKCSSAWLNFADQDRYTEYHLHLVSLLRRGTWLQ